MNRLLLFAGTAPYRVLHFACFVQSATYRRRHLLILLNAKMTTMGIVGPIAKTQTAITKNTKSE